VTEWAARAGRLADEIRAAGRWRAVRALDGCGPHFGLADGRAVVSFASNDYLGLSQHPMVKAAATAAVERFGTGAGSARLIVGDRAPHRQLEAELAAWKAAEAAVLFPTGFATNLGVLGALGAPDVLVVSDAYNHASIVDGCRLSSATVRVAAHADVDHVRAHLRAHVGPAIVVSDTVFSMDGDVAPLDGLTEACIDHGALLVLDDAHAVLPIDWTPPPELALVRVGTLSKTLGSLGGFAAGDRTVIDLIINRARSFIFTTAPTPADTAAATAALGVLRSPEGRSLVARLGAHVERVAPGHPTPIIPVVVGDEVLAVKLATSLLDDHGLLIPAIRPPTVPPGSSRLRIALSAAHTANDVERLVAAVGPMLPC
jgi:8-amino-7-oxononanoate synthase